MANPFHVGQLLRGRKGGWHDCGPRTAGDREGFWYRVVEIRGPKHLRVLQLDGPRKDEEVQLLCDRFEIVDPQVEYL